MLRTASIALAALALAGAAHAQQAKPVTVENFPEIQSVEGVVEVLNLPDVQPVEVLNLPEVQQVEIANPPAPVSCDKRLQILGATTARYAGRVYAP